MLYSHCRSWDLNSTNVFTPEGIKFKLTTVCAACSHEYVLLIIFTCDFLPTIIAFLLRKNIPALFLFTHNTEAMFFVYLILIAHIRIGTRIAKFKFQREQSKKKGLAGFPLKKHFVGPTAYKGDLLKSKNECYIPTVCRGT